MLSVERHEEGGIARRSTASCGPGRAWPAQSKHEKRIYECNHQKRRPHHTTPHRWAPRGVWRGVWRGVALAGAHPRSRRGAWCRRSTGTWRGRLPCASAGACAGASLSGPPKGCTPPERVAPRAYARTRRTAPIYRARKRRPHSPQLFASIVTPRLEMGSPLGCFLISLTRRFIPPGYLTSTVSPRHVWLASKSLSSSLAHLRLSRLPSTARGELTALLTRYNMMALSL